ncbi:UbiD family decarboxylase [Nocardia sp. CDC159]|uniref:Pyrrole-2-carboxylic acid decarboxylase n=1 Tax=Nocardia pulmonis TaxID=2951408 RepID=A0A9X2E9T4_9NOCA|nr:MULTISPECIES: UbiD family decarboxylase [Nocardia]MCM6775485.1 UbiD family decarboxylase [Nocardia pulmonis]MCM6787781.1 UbiD family decarboxylase [Nocardia sp. CDC159]
MKRLKSLREYLDRLKELGDLRTVSAIVDTHLEIGAIIRHSTENREPAPFFSNIRGYSKEFRVVGAPGALSSIPGHPWARIALALGLPIDTEPLDIVERVARAKDNTPIPPVVVESGPCQDNVLIGEEADITIFPTPLIHDGDGGRYFQTWGSWILSTPDGSWTNWSIARAMIHDRRHLTGFIPPTQHNGMIHKKWIDKGEPMPFALAQGGEPIIPLISGMSLPYGVAEADFIGGYWGEPLEVVKCKTVDLYVPAEAEIVVEGFVLPDTSFLEGPMGEYTGYQHGHPEPMPAYEITAITYRDNAILPVVSAGKPIDDDHTVFSILDSAEYLHLLREKGFPITHAWILPESAAHAVVITVPYGWWNTVGHTDSSKFCRDLAAELMTSHAAGNLAQIFVMDDDIDPVDMLDVMWGFASRCNPRTGHDWVANEQAVHIMILYTEEERYRFTGSTHIYNCLLRIGTDRATPASFDSLFQHSVKARALTIWNNPDEGIPEEPSILQTADKG